MAQQAQVEELAEDGAKGKKSNKKLIMIVMIVLLVVGGGGVAAWLLMGKGAKEGEPAAEQAHKVEVKEPVFIKLETFTVNLNPEEGDKYLQVDITLNASEQADADTISKYMPQVRNRILMILTSKLASEIADMDGKQLLSEELTEQINEPYSEGSEPLSVKETFFTSFVIQ
jgi:flagellar protein FliL